MMSLRSASHRERALMPGAPFMKVLTLDLPVRTLLSASSMQSMPARADLPGETGCRILAKSGFARYRRGDLVAMRRLEHAPQPGGPVGWHSPSNQRFQGDSS
jgi:hypothetical protein